MLKYCNRVVLTTISLIGSLAATGCFNGSNDSSSRTDNEIQVVKYIPKRSIPQRKPINFKASSSLSNININSNYVSDFFKEISNTPEFRQEIDLQEGSVVNYVFNPKLVKDINNDGLEDVILLVEVDKQNKKSFYRYYIVLFNNSEDLIPIEYLYAGGGESEMLINFTQITDSFTVVGQLKPNYFLKNVEPTPINYYFDGVELVSK